MNKERFQSLFFWIWNSDKYILKSYGLPSIVSILVFLDMEFRLCYYDCISGTAASFNPCFSGYGIQTLDRRFLPENLIGFNPCFSGYGIQT